MGPLVSSIVDYRRDARLGLNKFRRQGGGITFSVLLSVILCCIIVPVLKCPIKLWPWTSFLCSSEILGKNGASERCREPCNPILLENVSIGNLPQKMEPMSSFHYLGSFLRCKKSGEDGVNMIAGEYRSLSPDFRGSGRQFSTFRQDGHSKNAIDLESGSFPMIFEDTLYAPELSRVFVDISLAGRDGNIGTQLSLGMFLASEIQQKGECREGDGEQGYYRSANCDHLGIVLSDKFKNAFDKGLAGALSKCFAY